MPKKAQWLKVRVGEVKSLEPRGERLFVCQVDVGEPLPRQIVSGLRGSIPEDKLLGRKFAYLLNLASRKLMQADSHGMLLVARDRQDESLLEPLELADQAVPSGTRVLPSGMQGEPDAELSKKARMWEWILADVVVDAESGELFFREDPFDPKLCLPTLRRKIVVL